MPYLTVSIPAYNDAETLPSLVEEAVEIAGQITDDYEVLIIDDGSKDNTSEVARELVSRFPKVRLHVHPVNLGFGPTIRECYTMPESEWVFFAPGDAQIPPRELLKLMPYKDQFDFIIGYRKLRKDPFYRKVQSRVYNRLVTRLAGCKVHDVNSSALVRRTVLNGTKLECKSAFIHAKLLLEALRNGAKFKEIRIEHREREFGSASGARPSVILGTVRDLAGYWFRRR